VTTAEGFVRLALADNGKGVLQSFRDAGLGWSTDLDDAGALKKALEPFVSSKGSPTNEGVGLTLVSELTRLTGGMLLIVSGRGILTIDGKGSVRAKAQGSNAAFQGTLIALTVPQSKVKDFAVLLTAAKVASGLLRPQNPLTNFQP
jgi:hypothetical protein